MENATREFERLLVASAPGADLGSPIRDFERCLEGIAVVPAAVASRVRLIEQAGGSAKISGAGTLGERGAGALLVYHPSHPSDLRNAGHGKNGKNDPMNSALRDYVAYPAAIGATGLRLGRSGASKVLS